MLLFLACSSEEAKVRTTLDELAAFMITRAGESPLARGLRLQVGFRPRVAKRLQVHSPFAAADTYERDALVRGLTELGAMGPIGAIEFERLVVTLGADERRASVTCQALVSASQPGDLHAQRYDLQVELKKRGGQWLVTRVWVSDERRSLPEARP